MLKAAHGGLLTLQLLQVFKANDEPGNFQHFFGVQEDEARQISFGTGSVFSPRS